MISLSEVISFAGGVAAGLLTNMLWDMRYTVRRGIARLVEERRRSTGFDPRTVDLYQINRWSVSRPISREEVRMTVSPNRPQQSWCDPAEWASLVERLSESHGGRIAYLTGFSVDHRESQYGARFGYTVTPCDYSEYLATVRYLQDRPEVVARIREILARGDLARFAGSAPPSLIKVNVALINTTGRFLALQRSGAVEMKRGLWTTGPNETMRHVIDPVPGSRQEDLFDLAERCLREELGLEPSDYRGPSLSWIGYEAHTASVKVFAQVRTRLSEREVEERLGGAHGVFEVQGIAWLPLSRRTIAEVSEKWLSGDSAGRKWSSSAPFALSELWRMRLALTAP